MDKMKRIKTVLVVGFVVICGTVCVAVSGKGREGNRIVLEKKEDRQLTNVPAEAVDAMITSGAKAGTEATVPPEEQEEEICVHICGAVAAEGVYAKRTGMIPVFFGEGFLYSGFGADYAPSAYWYDGVGNLLGSEYYAVEEGVRMLKVPEGAGSISRLRRFSASFTAMEQNWRRVMVFL